MPYEFMADMSLTLPLDVGGCGLVKLFPATQVRDFGVEVYSTKKERNSIVSSSPSNNPTLGVKIPVFDQKNMLVTIEEAISEGDFSFLNYNNDNNTNIEARDEMNRLIQENVTLCFQKNNNNTP